jgi:hypothetical protein
VREAFCAAGPPITRSSPEFQNSGAPGSRGPPLVRFVSPSAHAGRVCAIRSSQLLGRSRFGVGVIAEIAYSSPLRFFASPPPPLVIATLGAADRRSCIALPLMRRCSATGNRNDAAWSAALYMFRSRQRSWGSLVPYAGLLLVRGWRSGVSASPRPLAVCSSAGLDYFSSRDRPSQTHSALP